MLAGATPEHPELPSYENYAAHIYIHARSRSEYSKHKVATQPWSAVLRGIPSGVARVVWPVLWL